MSKKLKYGDVDLPPEYFEEQESWVPLKLHKKLREENEKLRQALGQKVETAYWVHKDYNEEMSELRGLLREARELLLLCAPSIDERSPTYQEIKELIQKVDHVEKKDE